jgi:hypothetical protein
MPRRGGLDWEAANRRERVAPRAESPVYVRRSERSDQWLLRYVRFPNRCEACGDELVKGERGWMLRDEGGWRFLHEACR